MTSVFDCAADSFVTEKELEAVGVNLEALRRVWEYTGSGNLTGIGRAAHVLLNYPIRYQSFSGTYGVPAPIIAAQKREGGLHHIGDLPLPRLQFVASEMGGPQPRSLASLLTKGDPYGRGHSS